MTKPVAYVMVGLPASGKSTYAESLNVPVYGTDVYIEKKAKANAKTYNEVFSDTFKEANAWFNAMVDHAIENRYDFVWDQTNLSAKKRAKIIKRLKNTHDVVCVCFLKPQSGKEQAEYTRRMEAREGSKDIPVRTIVSMFENFKMPDFREGFKEIKFFTIFGEEIATVG